MTGQKRQSNEVTRGILRVKSEARPASQLIGNSVKCQVPHPASLLKESQGEEKDYCQP